MIREALAILPGLHSPSTFGCGWLLFSVLGQALMLSAFLVLFQPNGCPGALPRVKVQSRHCHHPLLTGACLAASLELSLSCSPAQPPTHSPQSCRAPVASGPWSPDRCGYHSSLKTEGSPELSPWYAQSLYLDARGRVVCASGPIGWGRGRMETWHPSG